MLSGLIFIGCVVWCCNRTMSPVRLLALLAGFVMAGAFVQPVPSVGRAAASLAPRQQQHRRVASLPVPELPTTTICWAADKNQVSAEERMRRTRRNIQLQNLEKDSQRWFDEQDRREAAGELNLLENPAFYTVLFFAVPVAILVWGAGTGVIPGFVTPTPYEF